jgi:hypothetical protein
LSCTCHWMVLWDELSWCWCHRPDPPASCTPPPASCNPPYLLRRRPINLQSTPPPPRSANEQTVTMNMQQPVMMRMSFMTGLWATGLRLLWQQGPAGPAGKD